MKIAVFSDTHGRIHNCIRALDALGKVDHIIHLGDTVRDVEDLGIVYPDIPISYVCGNSDFCAGGAYEKMIALGGKQFFICHGHTRGVKENLRELALCAKSADLVLFGHTHIAFDGYENGVHLFNPGSICSPQVGAPSFGLITIDNGVISTKLQTV